MRNKRNLLVGSCLLFISCNPQSESRPTSKTTPTLKPFSGTVVGVEDGDTINVLRNNGKVVKVRLYAVDCPETIVGFGHDQPFGWEATKFTYVKAMRKKVLVDARRIDHLGRIVGAVTLPTDTVLGEELVKAGLAWWLPSTTYDDKHLEHAESEAREEKKGLWASSTSISPAKFRAQTSSR